MTTPDEHADDPHRPISVLGDGPADIFASSGGAVNALALVARHRLGTEPVIFPGGHDGFPGGGEGGHPPRAREQARTPAP